MKSGEGNGHWEFGSERIAIKVLIKIYRSVLLFILLRWFKDITFGAVDRIKSE